MVCACGACVCVCVVRVCVSVSESASASGVARFELRCMRVTVTCLRLCILSQTDRLTDRQSQTDGRTDRRDES